MRRRNLMINGFLIVGMMLLSLFLRDILRLRVNRAFFKQFTALEGFRVENGCIDGYASFTKYLTVYMILFLAFLHYYTRQEDYLIIRMKKRKEIAKKRIHVLIKVILIIFIPHFMVTYLYNIIYYPLSLLLQTHYFIAETVYGLLIMMFFFTIGTLYMMLYDVLQRAIITGMMIGLSFLFFLVNRFYFQNQLAIFFLYRDVILNGQGSVLEITLWLMSFICLSAFLIMTMIHKVERMDILCQKF